MVPAAAGWLKSCEPRLFQKFVLKLLQKAYVSDDVLPHIGRADSRAALASTGRGFPGDDVALVISRLEDHIQPVNGRKATHGS